MHGAWYYNLRTVLASSKISLWIGSLLWGYYVRQVLQFHVGEPLIQAGVQVDLNYVRLLTLDKKQAQTAN